MTILSELTSKKPNPAPPCLVVSSSTSRVSAREGEDALLVVHKAPGSGPIIHMSWARGSRQLAGDRYRIGENNNTVHLNLQGITKDDEGEYTVTAKNIAGESRSAVQLRVKDNSEEDDTPIFLRRLNDLSVKVGTRTRFLVEIRSSSEVKVTWYRNDLPIPEEDRFHFLNEGNFFCVDVAPVTVEDGGRWACVAENTAGRSSCSCRLNVLIPKAYKAPEFLEELRAILTNQGTVSLECKVVGVPTPLLKWFKDGKEIKAGDVFALTANPDDPTSLGTYTCEAVNCMGKTYSSSRVHVMGKGSREGSLKPADQPTPTGPPPHFTEELKSEKVKIGSALTLACQVKVPPWPKSIQWYNKEGKVEPSEKYHIMEDGLGGYSIEICPLEACDEGEWKCVAMSDAGVMGITQCNVFMSYPKNYRKPKFLESLKAILTEEGLVSFECKVVGFPTPQLQWFKDGQELRPGDVYQLTGTNSLGSYSCIAKNCMGEARSTAELTVEDIQGQLDDEEKLLLFSKNQPPRFIRGLKSTEAKINEDFRFTVQVTIVPEPSLIWYKDDEKIEKTDRFTVVRENLGTCHLDIKKLEVTDQAEWKCVATNDFGQSVTSGFLKLTIPKHYKKPRFLECLRAILTEEGAVNLECKVIGVPQPSLKWYKDGKELKPGDIHKIISGQDGTCCLGTYTCEAHNCMGTVSSSASLLGFEDRMAIKESAIYKPELPYHLANNTSLSTINEERTSQLYDTPMSERSDVSFSFDGKEVSISLYETPDLTEDEALQVVEMYAEELSEHVSEQNVVELPPLRFTKESSKSGPLLMEAVVIDVTPEYFSSAEEDLRTEADFEDVSMSDETSHTVQSPRAVEDEAFFEKINTDFLEKALAGLSSPKKSSQEKSSGSDKDSYKSLSDHKKDDVSIADVSLGDGAAKGEVDRRGSKKGSKKDEEKNKKARSRSGSADQARSFDENVEEGIVTVVPKRKSVSRSSSGGSSEKPARKKSKSESVSLEQDTMIAEPPRKTKQETEEGKKTKRKASRGSSESTEETLQESGVAKKQKRSKSKSVEKENVAPKAPARKKKAAAGSSSDNKMEEETSGRGTKSSLSSEEKEELEQESERPVRSSSTSGIRKKRSSGSPSVDTEGGLPPDGDVKKRKSGRSRSSSADKSQKPKDVLKEVIEPQIEAKEAGMTESKPKASLLLLKNLKVTIQDIQRALTKVDQQIKTKCAAEALPPTADYKILSKPINDIQKNLLTLEERLNEEKAETPSVATLQSIDRPLQDLKTGLKLIEERKETTEIVETLEIFSLVLNHLQNQLGDVRASKEPEVQKAVGMLDSFAEPINHLNGAIDKVKVVLEQRPRPDKSQVSVELMQILARPVQDLKQVIERIEVEGPTSKSLSLLVEPTNNLKSAVSLLQQHAAKERPEDSVSQKILQRLTKPLDKIFKLVRAAEEETQGAREQIKNLSEPIQKLHKELAKMVQETLFPPAKSQSPYGESLPVLQKISQSTASILTNLTEQENLPMTVQQKRQIFLPLLQPLTEFKRTIDQINSTNEEVVQKEVFSSHLQNMDSQLAGIERNLETIPDEMKNEINQENLIQNVKEIRKEILLVFHDTQIGVESSGSFWNSLLGSLQKLNLNLAWKKPGEKPRQLLKKSSSSLGKSLEMLRQSSEEQFATEAQREEPKMSLAVLRPLEKPLQDLEEGFGVLVKHILETENLTEEEKPIVENQLQGLLEILSQSFESFQEKWVEIDANKSDATLQEANTLLELVKELHDGANVIQFQMTEFEPISSKASDLIRKNIYSNLKSLTGSISEVEKSIRKESLESIPNLKILKMTVIKIQKQLASVKSKTPEEAEVIERISNSTSKLLENLEKAKYKLGTEENSVWDQVVQKSILEFLQELESGAKTTATQQSAGCDLLHNAVALVDQLQQCKVLKIESLPRVTTSLEEFRSRLKGQKPKEIQSTTEQLLKVVDSNISAARNVPELKEPLTEPLKSLHVRLQQCPKLEGKTAEKVIQVLQHLEQSLEFSAGTQKKSVLARLTAPLEEIQEIIRTFETESPLNKQDSEVRKLLIEPLQQLSYCITKTIPLETTKELQKMKKVVQLIKTNLTEVKSKENPILQPLQQLQIKLGHITEGEQVDEATTKLLCRLVRPLEELGRGLLVYEIVPGETVKEFSEVAREIGVARELAVAEMRNKPSTEESLKQVIQPLEKVQKGITQALQPEVIQSLTVSKPKEEKLAQIINVIQKYVATVTKIDPIQAGEKLAQPLKQITAKLITVAQEGKFDDSTVEFVQGLVKPLANLQKGLENAEHLKFESAENLPSKETVAQITAPLMEVERQIANIESQTVLEAGAQGKPANEKQAILQELVQPLHQLKIGLLEVIQPLQTAEELKKEILPTAEHLKEVIESVEKNVTTLEKRQVLTSEAKQALTQPLEILQAKLVQATETGNLNTETATVIENLEKPLQELQESIQAVVEWKQEQQLNEALAAVATPLVQVQKEFASIEIQAGGEHMNKEDGILQEFVQPLHNLQVGIALALQPMESTEDFKPTVPGMEKLSEVIHLVERNVASLESKQVFSPETKEALTEPLKALEVKLVEVAKLEKADEKTVAVLEGLAKPLQALQEGLQSMEQVEGETAGDLKVAPLLSALAAPLMEAQKGVAAVQEQTVFELSQPKTTEEKAALKEFVEPLQKLQTGISQALKTEQTEELKLRKAEPTEKLSEVIHLVEANVATVSKVEAIQPEVKLEIIESLKALKVELVEASKQETATENSITVLQNLSEPLKKLEKALEMVQDISSETVGEEPPAITVVATSLTEAQKSIATVQQLRGFVLEKPLKPADAEILGKFALPLEKLQVQLSQIKQPSETAEELKLISPEKGVISEVIQALELNVAKLEKKDVLGKKEQENLSESLKALKDTLSEAETQKAGTAVFENLVEPLKRLQKGLEIAENVLKESTDELRFEAIKALATPFREAQKGLATIEQQTIMELNKPSAKTDEQKEVLTKVLEPLHKVQISITNAVKPKVVEEMKQLVKSNVNLIEGKDALQTGMEAVTIPLRTLESKLEEVSGDEMPKKLESEMEKLIKPLKNLQKSLQVIIKEKIDTIQDLEASPLLGTLTIALVEMQKGISSIQKEEKREKSKEKVLQVILPSLEDLKEGLDKILKQGGATAVQNLEEKFVATQGILGLIDQKALKSQPKLLSAVANLEEELNKESKDKNLKALTDSIAIINQELEAENVTLPVRQKNMLLRLKVELTGIEQNLSTKMSLNLKKPKEEKTLEKLTEAVKTLHKGIEEKLETEEGQLKSLASPLVSLENALEKLVIDEKSSGKEVSTSLQSFSQSLGKIEDQIHKEKALETLSQPIANIRKNIAAIEESSIPEEGLESLSESETSLLKTLAEEFHELQHAVSVMQTQPASEISDLSEKSARKEKATVRPEEQANVLTTAADVRESVGELSIKPEELDLLKVLTQSTRELNKALATVKEEVVLEGNKSLKEFSTAVLEKLAKPAQELTQAVAVVEQQVLLESKEASISSITSPSQLETLAKPIQALHRNLVEIQEQVTLLTEVRDEQKKTELVQAVAIPIEDLFRQVGAFQQQPGMDSDVTTISDKLDPSLLKTLARPAEEIKEILAVVQQFNALEPNVESLLTEQSKIAEEVAKPLRDLNQALVVFEQLTMEVATSPEKEWLPVIEAVAKPLHELEVQMAVMQSHQFVEDEAGKIKSTPTYEMLQKLATPLQELSTSISIIEQQVLEGAEKTLPEDETVLEDLRSLDTPKTVSELENAAVEQPQVLFAEDTSTSETTEIEKKIQEVDKSLKAEERMKGETEPEEVQKRKQEKMEKEITLEKAQEKEELDSYKHSKEITQKKEDEPLKRESEEKKKKESEQNKKKEEEDRLKTATGEKNKKEEELLKKEDEERKKKQEQAEEKKKKEEERLRKEAEEEKRMEDERLKKEAEEKKKKEEDRVKKEAEERQKKEEEEKMKKEAEERKIKEEEERLKKEAKEKKKKDEKERLNKEVEEKKKKDEEERLKKEAEEKKMEEEERLKKEAEEKKKKEEERLKKEEEKKKKEEEERLKKEAEEKKKKEAEERLKKEAEEKKKKEEEERLKKEAEEKKKKQEEERLKKEAEEKKKKEEEERLKKEAEEKKKKEAEERLKKEAEEKKKKEEEERLKKEAEERKKAEEKKKKEEEERLKKEAEERKKAEEKKKKEEEERLKKEAEEKKKKEEEERLKKEAEEKKKKEEEERLKKEAEEKKKKEEEERLKKEAEEKKKKEEEERLKKEAEEKKKKEEEERLKKEAEEKKKKEAEERLKKEAEEKKKKEEEERLKKEAEERKKAEEKKKKEEEERLKKEAEERKKAEEKKKKEEEERLKKEAEEKKKKEEEERLKKEAEERKKAEEKKKKEEEERLKKEAEERKKAEEKKKKEEEERLKKETEEKKKKEEEERLKKEAEERKKAEEKKKKVEGEQLKKEAEMKKEEEEKRSKKETVQEDRKDEEERLKIEAGQKKKEEEELLKKETEIRKKKETKDKVEKGAEEKKKKEDDEKLHTESEKLMKMEEEETVKKEADEQKKKEEIIRRKIDAAEEKIISVDQREYKGQKEKMRGRGAEERETEEDIRLKKETKERVKIEENILRKAKEKVFTEDGDFIKRREGIKLERDGRGLERSADEFRQREPGRMKQEGERRHLEHGRYAERIGRDDIYDIQQRKLGTYRPKESFGGFYRSSESLRDTYRSTESLRNAYKSTESLRNIYRSSEMLGDAHRSSESLRDAYRPTESWRDSRQSYENLYEIRKTHREPLGRYHSREERHVIKKKPSFCTRLLDHTASQGSTVKLTCTILSHSEPSIQWLKDGTPIFIKSTDYTSGRYRSKIQDGVASLEITNVGPGDSGEYTCLAQNPLGEVSTTSTLRVYGGYEPAPFPPTFTRPISECYKFSEDELTLECRVRSQPTPRVVWMRNGNPIRASSRYQITERTDGLCSLTIYHPEVDDSGEYTCKAENAVASSACTHHLTFSGRQHYADFRLVDRRSEGRRLRDYQKPQFHLGLTDSHVPIGGTIALQVELRGTPREVKWLRGAEELPRASSRIRSFEDSGVYTLLVSDASEKESGTYTCRAYSSFGHVETSAAVQVIPVGAIRDGKPPKILNRPNTLTTVTVEDDVTFTCRVTGQPKPKVTWLKGVKDITITDRTMVEHSDDYYKFTLKRVVPADAGTYWIVAKNMHGSDRAFATVQIKQRARSLTPDPFSSSRWNWGSGENIQEVRDTKELKERYRVKETPGPIAKEPFVVDSGRNWMTLSWSKPVNRGAAPVAAYRVDIWQDSRWSEIGVSPVNSFDVFNLKQGVEYKFRITPRNRYGWGESLVTSTPITLGNKVINIPEFVKILPGQQKALLGSEIKLECQVVSDVLPSIMWYKDSLPIDFENEKRFSSKFDGRNCLLKIENLKEEDSGRYMCEAVNRMGRVSTFARLMVVNDPKIWEADTHLKREMLEEEGASESFPPQFTMRLRDRRVQMTYPVRLTCQVLGSPTPELVWCRDGVEITQDDRHTFTSEDHFYTLEISKTILEDSGCYTATAKNDSGSVSCHCNLVVDKGIRAYVAPEFVTELAEKRTVKYGEELRLSAQVEAYPSVGVVWHRNGVRLRPSRRIIMTLDHDGTIELAIAGITERESGTYTCTATNEVGRCETTCKVTVVPETSTSMPQIQEPQLPYSKAPMFLTKPRSSEALEGDTVIIDCEVVGDPKPEVFWLRDFLKPDYYRDSPHFRRQGEGPSYRLEIPHAKLDFTGTYSVVARNVHGEAKAVISLQIYAKGQGKEDRMDHSPVTHGNVETLPVFQKHLKDLRCCDGDAVTLECVVSAATQPEIRWEKGGRLLPLGNDFVASFDGKTATLTIKQVYPEDEGEYTCVASNEVGRTYTSACLVVDVPEEKENLLSRQLTRPSGLMSGASTPRSTPRTTPSRSISPYPSGYGWRESSVSAARQKRLKVAPPKFYAVPHNRIAEEGETVRFQCSVAGHPTPWVTWDKDNIVVTPSARITISEKEDLKVLEIEQVTLEDAGLYRVTLENEVGRVEATARLDIMGPRGSRAKAQAVRSWSASPTFRRRLMGSIGRLGGNVTLACDIKASPSPVTSWYRNGELLVRTSRISPTWDGQTAMLEIEDLEMDDAGVYTCSAENEFGKCHCSAELSVLEEDEVDDMRPVFVEPLTNVTVQEGIPAELQVRIKGSSPLDVVWVKNNKEIPNCEDFRYVDYDDGRFGLRIADPFSEDSGEYFCEVFNQYGEAVSSAQLLVKEPVTTELPKIGFSKKPTSVIVTCGRSASFCCRLQHQTADPPPSIVQWKVGDRIIGPTTSSPKYLVEENGDVNILLIKSVDQKDVGQIICTARYTCLKCSVEPYCTDKCDCTNAASYCSAELALFSPNDHENWGSDGECDTKHMKKSIRASENESDPTKMLGNRAKYSASESQSPATILRGPTDVNVFRGDRVVLRATYSGSPEPQVGWMKGGRVLENNERMSIIKGEGATSLSFDCISADDSGKYVVCVENEFGADCHFSSVAVEGPPDPPASYPIVTNVGNNSVEVEWSSPAFDGGSKITGYIVEAKTSPQGKWTGISGPCHSLSYIARNLQPNTRYRFRVRAENVHGQSEPSYESNEIAIVSEALDFTSELDSRTVVVEDSEAFKAKYEVLEELGKGRYGVVHKVADLETGQKMAAKFIRCIKVKDKEKVKEEIDIMNSLRHPKLLRLAAAFESPREMVMVMEYISGGELFERVVADDFQLTERDCILFMRQICEGVEYMHKNSVVHLDLKPENIMCRSRTSHEIKLIDFGLARKIDPENPVRVLFGTPEFVPPEVINYEPIGFESDMWSVGVICYVLLSGLSPFMGENDAETFANITRSSYDFDEEAFKAISQDAKDFISSLLIKRKEKRLTASDCLKNKWMTSEDDKTMGVILSTDKLKKFIIRRKWQKTGNAIRALGRMASLSAASRKNSQVAKPAINEETTEVDACGINSSRNNSCLHQPKMDKVNETIPEEQVKDINSKQDPARSKLCDERSDSGISDCSSVGSGSNSVTCRCSSAPLLNKKYSISEEDELKSIKTENISENSISPPPETESKLPKEVIGTKVDNIRKKFANLSKNIDEMDKKLENVGKKLVDIGPGKITASKKPEIKRVPSLKDHKNPEVKKSNLMQHTASSQAKITIAIKQPPSSPKEISTLTIPVAPELRTAKLTRTRVSIKNNQSSISSPTAKGKLADGVKSPGLDDGGHGAKTQPSPKIQRLQQVYNTKVAAVSKDVGQKTSLQKKGKDLVDSPKGMHKRQANFQETVAFWKG